MKLKVDDYLIDTLICDTFYRILREDQCGNFLLEIRDEDRDWFCADYWVDGSTLINRSRLLTKLEQRFYGIHCK